MIKDLKILGIIILSAILLQTSAFADDAWNDFKDKAKNAGEDSTISVPSDLQANGTSAGFLQKKLKIDFNNHTIKGSNYTSDAPLIFSGAGGQNDTRMYIENATFTGFNVGDNGVLNNTNPHLELTDVSFTNNIGRAINNNAYNRLSINARDNDVTISNDYSGDGILSKSTVYLNAYEGKTLRIDDNIKVDNNLDGGLSINNTAKKDCDLNGTVFLNGKIKTSDYVSLGANFGYKNGTLKLGVTPANSTDFKLNVAGESILDLQNENVDTLTMSQFKGSNETPLHLKLDYNAQTGKMDTLNIGYVNDLPSLIVDEINILVGGDATNTHYLDGSGRNLVNFSKDALSAMKDGKTYVFTPDSTSSEFGAYIVSKATDITNSLYNYISTDSQKNDKIVSISSDITLTKDLGELIGQDRETTIFGNGYKIDGNNAYNGVQVKNGQTFGFNNITLEGFKDYAIENEGITNLTSTTINSTIKNSDTLNLYGNNTISSNITNGIHSGRIYVKSGTTTIDKNAKLDAVFVIAKTTDATSPKTYLENNGVINVTSSLEIDNAKMKNTKDIEAPANIIIKNGGTFENDNGNIKAYIYIEDGELTTKKGTISGGVQLDHANSVYNIIGGKEDDETYVPSSVMGTKGNINLLNKIVINPNTTFSFTGKTTVKEGAELKLDGPNDYIIDSIFHKGELVFEDNSTLNLTNMHMSSYGQEGIENNNIVIEKDKTLNLKIDDGVDSDKAILNFSGSSTNRDGNIRITELELSKGDKDELKVIDDPNGKIYERTSLADNFKLENRSLNSANINTVMYDNSHGLGVIKLSSGTLKDMLASLDSSRFYEMKSDETLDEICHMYDDATVIVQGDNNTLNFENNAKIDIDSNSKVVLNNLNMENAEFRIQPNKEVRLIINNDSGKAITLNKTYIDHQSGEVFFKGNSDINFNGVYHGNNKNTYVDLNDATLTRDGKDNNVNWNLVSGTLKYLKDSDLSYNWGNVINFRGGNLDLRNGVASEIYLGNLQILDNKTSNLYVDVDLANKTMDKLLPTHIGAIDGKLNIAGMNLLSDADDDVTTINFTNNDRLMSNTEYTGAKAVAYSPIFKYNVSYDKTDGNFTFLRGVPGGDPNGNPSEAFNPAILATPVATQIGGYLTQLNTYEQAFANQDMLMSMTKNDRTAMKFANKIASTQGTSEGGVITFSPNQISEQNKGLWFRPFATFESVSLRNGPSVRNIGYGSLFGGDTGIIELKHDWDAVYSAYVGYNGSNQNYNGVSMNQNGGSIGLSGIWYKDNFFTGLTANIGASAGEAHTMYGTDEFAMLLTGVASKTGYNFELADGKFVIQPNFLMSYSFVNTFDYTTASGVKISSDPLHAIQIAPGLKFIGNLKNGFQPYVSLQMVWNIIDKSKFMANNVSLPEMSVDPYFQYGVGLQKRIGERFTGFGQAMVRNGGRNGIALQFGFKWAI